MASDSNIYIKTNRVFSRTKKYSWLLVPLIAGGGLFYPKLGLLLIPIMITLITLGFLKGKYWCGNICPHGSLFDSVILPFSPNRGIAGFFKSQGLKIGFFIFYMGMFTTRLVKVASLWGTMPFLDKLGFAFAANYLVPTTVGLILALFINPRTWCSFCPMGTIEQLAYKLGKRTGLNRLTDRKVSITSAEFCHKCGKCSRVCPMQLKPYLEFSAQNQFENENCIRCTTCVANCPAGILTMASSGEINLLQGSIDLSGYEYRTRAAAVVERIKVLAPDIREYTFRIIEPKGLKYEPGQFILLKVMDEPQMYRAYSISSLYKDGQKVSIIVKKIDQGLGSGIIFDRLKAGDSVELEGPLGRELVVDAENAKILLVAGGIGITPFLPIVEDLLQNKNFVQTVQLIYGVNRETEFIYDEYFKKMADLYDKFTYLPTVAMPGADWQGRTGFVTDVMNEMNLEGYKIYMCGPKPMTNAAHKTLGKKGFPGENVFAESA